MASLESQQYLIPHSKMVSQKEWTCTHLNGKVNVIPFRNGTSFLEEIVSTAVYLRNKSPIAQLKDVTPYDGTSKKQMSAIWKSLAAKHI